MQYHRFIYKSSRLYFLYFIYILVLVLPAPVLSKGVSPFFFIHLSDPQLGFKEANKNINFEVEAMNKAIDVINRLKPPFIIITGDFVNNSHDTEQIAAYKQLLKRVDKSVKIWMVPGNHDISSPTMEDCAAYRKNYGNPIFSFCYGDCAFIGIDSNVIKQGNSDLEQKQYVWLKEQLEKGKDMRFRFVFMHCPPVLNTVDEEEGYSNFSMEMRRKYLSLFQHYKVNTVFAGHLHDNAYCNVNGVEIVTIGSIGKALGQGYAGMNLVQIFPKHYENCYLPLNEFPETMRNWIEERTAFSSANGLVMAGYQGWFSAQGDGSALGWQHYEKQKRFEPGSCTIDLWPDVSEYTDTYPTPFYLEDGSQARVYSSKDSSTVDVHFRWMRDYGIDGVYMQRFITTLKDNRKKKAYNQVLHHAFSSACRYNRALCIMYDLSGMQPGDESILIDDWKYLKENGIVSNRTPYLYHHGKPLVAVWGVGFNDGRRYGLDEAERIIDFLKKEGCAILVGLPAHWRDLKNDAIPDSRLYRLIAKSDIVLPWLVGRFDYDSYENYRKRINDDLAWCKRHGKDYIPVLFPGFSWHNMNQEFPLNQIPRLEGRFFGKQVKGAVDSGAKSLYLAMFDEMDEGTAFFKCTSNPPIGESTFVTFDNQPSDTYLRLAGEAARYMRGEEIHVFNK